MGDHVKRVDHLRAYLDICIERGDVQGQATAYSRLAAAHREREEIEKAIDHLQANLDLADRTGQMRTKAEVCCDLGVIYNQQGRYLMATQYFEQYFNIAKEIKEQKMVDQARVYLGISRGNARVQTATYQKL